VIGHKKIPGKQSLKQLWPPQTVNSNSFQQQISLRLACSIPHNKKFQYWKERCNLQQEQARIDENILKKSDELRREEVYLGLENQIEKR